MLITSSWTNTEGRPTFPEEKKSMKNQGAMLRCSASHLANVLHLTLDFKVFGFKVCLDPIIVHSGVPICFQKDNTEKHSRKILDSMNPRNSKAAIFYQ